MSAIAAAVTINPSAPAPPPALVSRLLDLMPERGRDGRAVTAVGSAVLGHGLFQTLPEDRPGAQPAASPDGTVTVILDGRMDNRSELLALAGEGDSGQCDAAVLAAAIARAGDRAWARAAGDFAAIAWDAGRRRAQAMRDVFGLRPLYLAVAGEAVYLASEPRALASLVPVALDEGYLAEWLSGRLTSRSATPIAAISRLEPAHLLTISTSELRQDRLVTLEGMSAALRAPSDLYDEFRHRFDTAVRARLRRVGSAGVLLSGGLDSTTVLLRARALGDRIEAFTVDQRPSHSETALAAATAATAGVAHHVVPATAGEADYADLARRWLAPPPHPAAANSLGARAAASARGCRVLLNGLGGDELFTTNPWACADLARTGRLVDLAEGWRDLRRDPSPTSWRALVMATLVPLLPAWSKGLARRVSRQTAPPAWIDRRWARRVGLSDRLRADDVRGDGRVATRVRLADLLGGPSIHANEEGERLAVETGVDDRAPYFDRDLAAFAIALPDALVALAPEPKAFVREACAAWLPPAQRHAVAAPDFAYLQGDALSRLGGASFFDGLQVVERGFVDQAWLRRAVDATWPGRGVAAADSPHLAALWHVASTELLVKAVAP